MDSFKYIDVNQNTDEWLSLRCGKLTSSNLGKVMANFGKSFGEPAKKLSVNIANEIITGNYIDGGFSNEHMQRGHVQEPLARMEYEDFTFCEVDNGGFFESEFVGCSPDGLVDNDGVIEIKSVIPSVHFANIKRQGIDPAYRWQCIGNLKFTGRDWLDFISYCSDFPEGKKIFIHRIHKKNLTEEFSMIDERLLEFKSLVYQNKKLIQESMYNNY